MNRMVQDSSMRNTLRTVSDFLSGLCTQVLLILCLTYSIQGMAGEVDTYRYKLEQNNNNKVCSHMADVYNKFFKKPFNATIYQEEYVKSGGVMPALLPGAKQDFASFINMRFSFQPSSPEFDAIKWRVGMETHHNHGETDAYLNTPFIAADVDINNDGQIETVIKDGFMGCYIPGCNSVHADVLSIFHKGDIDLMQGPIEWDVFLKGQNAYPPLAVTYGQTSSCDLVRPFIYDGMTYLSCYHQKWLKDFRDFRNRTPDREYTDILKYQSVEKLPDGRSPIKAETVCRFRMTVLEDH
jgi:uncharacterized protein (UPF0297 family)